ncbi:tail fiber protein [Erwinia oleae]|uniref:tail fiber protein n=1 Tax=Erwinia oleae TaxID=796334 RepID=UPI000554C572|nr:tail fiber protein [Erwinia oleae]
MPAKKTHTSNDALPEKMPGAGDQNSEAETLKQRFKQGSVPLESDFANLIDMANAGYTAIGKAAAQGNPGAGMRISASGQLEPAVEGLNFAHADTATSPLKLDIPSNQLVIDLDLGLSSSTNGISVKAGEGITVDTNGISINPETVLPKGIITMFSGDTVPTGWALCDGKKDTPNLIDRFILGGSLSDSGYINNATLSGSSVSAKTINISPDKFSVKTTIGSTTLTQSQIPSHNHYVPPGFNNDNNQYEGTKVLKNGNVRVLNFNSGADGTTNSTSQYLPQSSSVGGNGSHTHSATSILDSGEIEVPYYILAFIMKT